jgi:hypothetical protein
MRFIEIQCNGQHFATESSVSGTAASGILVLFGCCQDFPEHDPLPVTY